LTSPRFNSLTSIKYRPEIDGLRAVAVLSVLVFHLNPRWMQGGFVGVDVFFVISGYLITSVVARDVSLGRFSLLTFYQRRIARIFPAFFLVVLATLGGAFLFYSEVDFASAAAVSVFATLSTVNLKLVFQGNYFEMSRDAQPLLHYWSLSVEEQFYLVFPFAFLLIAKKSASSKVWLLSVVGVVSMGACILGTRAYPAAAFYLLPTRAWELLVGCTIAIHDEADFGRKAPLFRPGTAVVGLLAIGASFFVLKEDASFPGYQAALPVLGTLCVIGGQRDRQGLAGRLLSAAPMVLVGRMSYSLYLWHWPIFSLVDYRLYLASGATRMALKLGLTTIATVGTFYLYENPVRRFLNLPRNRSLAFTCLGCAVFIFVPVGIVLRRTNFVNADESRIAGGGITINDRGKAGSIVFMGDSFGSMYGRMMRDLAIERDYRLTVLSVAGGDPLPPASGSNGALWRASLAIVRSQRPDVLFIACQWDGKLQHGRSRLRDAVGALRPLAGHVVLLTQPPYLPEKASRASMREGVRPPFFEDDGSAGTRREIGAFLKSIAGENVSVIDVESYFLSPRTREIHFLDERGRQLYQDSQHISGVGAVRVREGIEALLADKMIHR